MTNPITRITKACKHCGSTDVEINAWACWDDTAQGWILKTTDDSGHHCEECDGPTEIINVSIPEA